jgi:predicted HD superfamily hydrolase involved in NAD metabolism
VTDTILSYLTEHLPPERLKHTLGTVKTAESLAARHGVSEEKARLAALLHDAAKGFTLDAMVRYVRRNRLTIPVKERIIRENPELLHGFISADIARKKFGVRDRDILEAIAYHTIGRKNMSRLAKIIYLADATAPDRRYPALAMLRAASRRDLDAAFQLTLAHKIAYVLKNKQWLHPGAVEAWNSLIKS